MTEAATIELEKKTPVPDVTGFTNADLPKFGNWLAARLAKRCPAYSEAYYLSQIRAWSSLNSTYFVKCGTSVGLFYATREMIDPRTVVREEFVWKMTEIEKNDREMTQIYYAARRWAKSLTAKSMWLGLHSDMTYGVVKSVVDGILPQAVVVDLTK